MSNDKSIEGTGDDHSDREASSQSDSETGKETFGKLRGLLKDKTNGVQLSVDEINEAITEAAITRSDAPAKKKKVVGAMKGQFEVPKDFDEPLPEDILKEFEADIDLSEEDRQWLNAPSVGRERLDDDEFSPPRK